MKKITLSMVFICLSLSYAMGASIFAGEMFSLALKEDGAVWAWGDNWSGQLGDGTTEDRHTPVQANGITDVISISAGEFHSLALKRDGTVWAWGYNAFGQLGNGTTTPYYTPTPTPGLVIGISGVTAIAAGGCHSLLLKSDGTVWACGINRNGQLGDGTTTDRSTPVQVSGLFGVISIAGGGEHSLALKSDGTVWAWGWNHVGQLGDGNGGEWPYFPTNCSTVPVQTIGLSNVTAIAGGFYHSLALKNDGTVWAWGWNGNGELGVGNSMTNSPIPVQSLISGIIAIKGGLRYSLALASYGTVWFWGYMDLDGWSQYISSIIPVPVDGISGVKAIAAGYDHALAVKNDGTVWAWGRNLDGELGDGTTTARRYPVQVQGVSLAASSAPASVLAADFDADGRADPTAVDNSGQWFFWHSSSSYSREGPIALGMGDLSPIASAAGDVDGDAKADMAIVDSSGNWYFWLSSRGYSLSGPQACGVSGTPVLGDFDGDGKADPVIVDSSGNWFVWLSADGYSQVSAPFAISGGTPLAGDFDGDGKADPVMVSSNGAHSTGSASSPQAGSGQGWYFWLSSSWYIRQGPYNFGLTGKPVSGDFDGDGKADPAVMDSSGNWNFWLSGSFYTRDGPYYLVLP